MKSLLFRLVPVVVALFFVTAGAPYLNAQITDQIQAHINHSFIIGNTTLPAGDYSFRMIHNTELTAMTATNAANHTTIQFLVRDAMDTHTPAHSRIFFRKYGDAEFLSKIYQVGSKSGVRVIESSRLEESYAKQGQKPMEHVEEQK